MESQPCPGSTFVDFEDKIDSNLNQNREVKSEVEEDPPPERDSGFESGLSINESGGLEIEGEVEFQQDDSTEFLTTYTFADLEDPSTTYPQYTYARIHGDQMGISRIIIEDGKYSIVR